MCDSGEKYLQEIDFTNLTKWEEETHKMGGGTVSRCKRLDNYFFLLLKPFSANSRTADSKTIPFLSFQPFLAEKMALEVKKARFNPFVLPSDFFKSDGDPVYLNTGFA